MFRYFVLIFCFFQMVNSIPMAKRMVDMSYVFDNTTLHWPTTQKFEITQIYTGMLNNVTWFQAEEYASATHVGTHMDAPCHFAMGRWTIDEIPISRFTAPAAVVDVTHQAEANRDYQLTIDDLTEWENHTNQFLNEVILLIRSGWGKRWHSRELFTGTPDLDYTKLHFPGIHPDAAQWLVDNRNVYGIGTETLSLDFGPSTEFLSHKILLNANIFGLENVANMAELPLYGATLYAMPMKIGKASGAPTRIVATFPEIVFHSRHTHVVTEDAWK